MHASARFEKAAVPYRVRLPAVDASSWISWAAYMTGFLLALSPAMARDIVMGGSGRTVLVAAIAVFFAAVLAIQRHMRLSLKANTFGEPCHLVTGGIFRVSRNPIYVAFLVPLASIGSFSPWAAAAAIAIYVLAMTRFVIRREEAVLQARFGAAYLAYLRATPRWVCGETSLLDWCPVSRSEQRPGRRRRNLLLTGSAAAPADRMRTPMTHSMLKTASFTFLLVVAALVPLFAGTAAQAKGGKDVFIQDYTFKQPMNGVSGAQGGYYCDYQRLPNRQCDASGNNCRIVSWTLRQMCQ